MSRYFNAAAPLLKEGMSILGASAPQKNAFAFGCEIA